MAKVGKVTQTPGAHIASNQVRTIALGTDDDQVVWHNKTGGAVNITGAFVTPETAVTGDTTNTLILRLLSRLATGAAGKNVSDLKPYITGTDLTAFVADALVLSTVAADLRVEDGEALVLQKTEDGTGLALPASVVTVTYEFIG